MCLRLNLDIEKSGFHLQLEAEAAASGFTAIFGPSGCGKTTLLRTVAGLERHPRCRVSFGDETWQDGRCWIPTPKRRLGLVFQQAGLFPHLNVKQNLLYGWKRSPDRDRDMPLSEIVRLMELSALLERRVGGLSGGEARRVAMARAILSRPRLLLMDEPLAALDMPGKQRLFPFLERLHRELKLPVLYVTHDLEEVARLADRILLLEKGRRIAHAPVNAVLCNPEYGLTGLSCAQSVLEGTVTASDSELDLLVVDSPAGRLRIPGRMIDAEKKVRIQILARDVSIALNPCDVQSVLNVLPAVITRISGLPEGQCLLNLKVGEADVLCRITRYSSAKLRLTEGRRVYAQVKAAALLNRF